MLKYILPCIVALCGFYAWSIFPIKHGPGETIQTQPKLEYISRAEQPFNYKGNELKPIKKYEARVRVLNKKRYFFDERRDISPMDLLVGWNEMSDERNLNFIKFEMDDRDFEMEYIRPPIQENQMLSQMDLLHMIPSSPNINKEAKKLRNGNLIALEGLLVDVESSRNYNWNNNLVKAGTNETRTLIIWVTKLEVL